jgi:phospholipase/carboxylesterase
MLIETHAGAGAGDPVIVLLHGFMGTPEDLSPFAKSLGLRAHFVFPRGIVDLASQGLRGYAWWPIDLDSRRSSPDWQTQSQSPQPRDLSGFVPDGLGAARSRLDALLDDVSGGGPLIVGGFSQGAMLACDATLRSTRRVDGLAMFSGARIAAAEWGPRYAARRGLRAFVSHGRNDVELSFAAADSFRQDLAAAGWTVTWVPFDGPHEIPIVAWRLFKRWVTA